jgi:pimeloyl-ACP methyl ester carboxylesterase
MDWSPEADAADLAALLRVVAPEGAHLVGHSRGGTSASWLAVRAPELVRSLVLVASPPHASEVFRATFRAQQARARDARATDALAYLATIPDEAFPTHELRRFQGRALVIEPVDDPLHSPTHAMFWRMFLPFADVERVAGGHRFFADTDEGAARLAARILEHVAAVEAKDA